MMKKIFAVALLSLALTACETSGTENENGNAGAKPTATTAAPATPAPTAEEHLATPAQFKAGDKVKVKMNGTSVAATVVSLDEKSGKVTIRVDGEKQDKTVSVSDITKQ